MWMPKDVREWFDDIERGTGQPPRVEKIGDRRFQITAENERVTMTLDLKMTSPGKWVWAYSTLTVDGERRPLAKNAREFFRLFRDPDSNGLVRVDPADEEPFEPYPADELPVTVQNLVGQLTGRLAHLDPVVRAGRLADGTPLVEATVPHGYVRVKVGAALELRVVRDGYDVTVDAKDGIESALRSLTEDHDPTKPAPAAPGRARRATEAQRNTSVEVRRATVFRI